MIRYRFMTRCVLKNSAENNVKNSVTHRKSPIEILKAMEKIEKETCIRFEERIKNQHQEMVSWLLEIISCDSYET